MKNIIVFGATGGIGAYTVLHLHDTGKYNVIAVGHRKNDNGFFEQYGISYYSVDISDYKSFDVLPKVRIEAVVNLAGVLPARSYDPRMYISSFTMGQLNVLEYMNSIGCKKIISAQTPADLWYLQNTTTPMPADAQRSFPPSTDHSIYTIAKNAAIDITEYYHNTFGISRFILRFFNVYMYHPNPYYGRESEFIKEGDYYRPNDSETYRFVSIHKDCFKHKESCYTIAIFKYDDHEDFWELNFVGDRPLDLNDQEKQDFWKVIEIGYKYLNEFKEDNE